MVNITRIFCRLERRKQKANEGRTLWLVTKEYERYFIFYEYFSLSVFDIQRI